MPVRFNKERLKAFVARRRINALGLSIITFGSVLITLCCALTGFKRTDVLVVVTIALIALCLIQALKTKKFFRTIKSFKGKKKHSS